MKRIKFVVIRSVRFIRVQVNLTLQKNTIE